MRNTTMRSCVAFPFCVKAKAMLDNRVSCKNEVVELNQIKWCQQVTIMQTLRQF